MAWDGVSRDGDGMERGGMGWGRRCPALTAAPRSPPAPQNFWATLAAVGAPRPPCPRGDPGAGPHVTPRAGAPRGCSAGMPPAPGRGRSLRAPPYTDPTSSPARRPPASSAPPASARGLSGPGGVLGRLRAAGVWGETRSTLPAPLFVSRHRQRSLGSGAQSERGRSCEAVGRNKGENVRFFETPERYQEFAERPA